jgi:glycosyltransferase involved in cell wall biosynthesis
MKITCLIDSLGSGGAQRQLCTLAVLLKKRGMDVSMLTYHPYDFFLPMLQEAGIEYTCLQSRSIPRRILAVRRALRHGSQDVVLAFLAGPTFLAELAAIPRRTWGLVVSERNAVSAASNSHLAWLRHFHRIADYVTTNSHTNRLMIERAVPSLKGRTVTIYNAVDLQVFPSGPLPDTGGNEGFRMMVAARYERQKHPSGLIKALALARAKAPSLSIQLDWYGRHEATLDEEVYSQAKQVVEQHGLQNCVRLHGESRTIMAEYRRADAVALPSFYEGLPNTICEAMACGRPILMSDVCDAGNLVKNGHNGFLFDPFSPEDIARAILEFAALNVTERESMGRRSREMAERMFDPVVVAARYAEILSAAAARKRLPIEHWIPDVPDSAYRSLD